MFLSLIIALIVFGLLYWLVTLLPLPEPFPTIIKVVVVLALIYWVATHLLGVGHYGRIL